MMLIVCDVCCVVPGNTDTRSSRRRDRARRRITQLIHRRAPVDCTTPAIHVYVVLLARLMDHYRFARWRLSSVVVCNTADGRDGRPPGAWSVGRPTLHGGPVRLRPVRATPCYTIGNLSRCALFRPSLPSPSFPLSSLHPISLLLFPSFPHTLGPTLLSPYPLRPLLFLSLVEICERKDKQTDKHTDTLMAILCTPYWGRSNESSVVCHDKLQSLRTHSLFISQSAPLNNSQLHLLLVADAEVIFIDWLP